MGPGSWSGVLGYGSWILGPGSRSRVRVLGLGPGSGSGSGVPALGLGTGSWVLGPGSWSGVRDRVRVRNFFFFFPLIPPFSPTHSFLHRFDPETAPGRRPLFTGDGCEPHEACDPARRKETLPGSPVHIRRPRPTPALHGLTPKRESPSWAGREGRRCPVHIRTRNTLSQPEKSHSTWVRRGDGAPGPEG